MEGRYMATNGFAAVPDGADWRAEAALCEVVGRAELFPLRTKRTLASLNGRYSSPQRGLEEI